MLGPLEPVTREDVWMAAQRKYPEEMREIDTVLGRVHVRISGSGEAMMFWPSLLMTGDMWKAKNSPRLLLSMTERAALLTFLMALASSARTSSETRGAA